MTKCKRYLIFIPLIVIFSILSILRLIELSIIKKDYYLSELSIKTNRVFASSSAPRGRILDRNGNILVDNIGVKTINYTKLNGLSIEEEIEIAKSLADIIQLDEEASELTIKNYWLVTQPKEAYELITKEEYELLKFRKLTSTNIKELMLERISEELINSLNEKDRLAALIYELMNKGYKYEKKVIKSKNVSEKEFALLSESHIKGITLEQSWQRVYPYGNTLRSILGNISTGLPLEEKEHYLSLDYSLNDRVGVSYLEKEYEEYLKGEKDLYYINNDNTLSLYKEGKRGNDLVLSIDINIQKKLENILMNNLINAKDFSNTKYFNHAYGIISDPLSGSILAMSGKQVTMDINDYKFTDITANIISSSYTMGSVVKGASMAVGYQNNLIEIGKKITDACVKLYFVPQKCSYKRLGKIDEISALKYSSNYYQFLIAIKLVGKEYKANMKLNATEEHFSIYRNTLASFGLGSITGIDLPGEKLGVIGSIVADDLLLNLSIGQYDTYTPIEVVQYINTIANNGVRLKPSLMLRIIDEEGNIVKEKNAEIINTVELDSTYINKIQEGFGATALGTAYGYINYKYNPIGKTGTSESFLAGIKTVTRVYAGYYPKEEPKYSIVILTPHISYDSDTDYTAPVNRMITKEISTFLFENY